ncbi:phosphatidylinositol N-acetylglucosaminyltransferase subunit gpi1 [Pelomyxa schiedti]|nr:phosphatidylinositol N-acetylglucosaminyltransferase subunit gpi1 [Pelomyxa schiedti]
MQCSPHRKVITVGVSERAPFRSNVTSVVDSSPMEVFAFDDCKSNCSSSRDHLHTSLTLGVEILPGQILHSAPFVLQSRAVQSPASKNKRAPKSETTAAATTPQKRKTSTPAQQTKGTKQPRTSPTPLSGSFTTTPTTFTPPPPDPKKSERTFDFFDHQMNFVVWPNTLTVVDAAGVPRSTFDWRQTQDPARTSLPVGSVLVGWDIAGSESVAKVIVFAVTPQRDDSCATSSSDFNSVLAPLLAKIAFPLTPLGVWGGRTNAPGDAPLTMGLLPGFPPSVITPKVPWKIIFYDIPRGSNQFGYEMKLKYSSQLHIMTCIIEKINCSHIVLETLQNLGQTSNLHESQLSYSGHCGGSDLVNHVCNRIKNFPQQSRSMGTSGSLRFAKRRNAFLLIAIDIFIGMISAVFLRNYIKNVPLILKGLAEAVGNLKHVVRWLMGCPAGLKMNKNLDDFFGDICLYMITLWTRALQTDIAHKILHCILVFLCFIALSGLSSLFCAISDIMFVGTIHVHLLYHAISRLFNLINHILTSLFRRLVGKKRNPLRKRIDTCVFELDQMLFGTAAFSILALLWPTVTVYFLFFAGMYLMRNFCQGILLLCSNVLIEFPLYHLTSRAFCPGSFPGDMHLEILSFAHHPHTGNTFFMLKSTPVSTSVILQPLTSLISAYTRNSIARLRSTMTGDYH